MLPESSIVRTTLAGGGEATSIGTCETVKASPDASRDRYTTSPSRNPRTRLRGCRPPTVSRQHARRSDIRGQPVFIAFPSAASSIERVRNVRNQGDLGVGSQAIAPRGDMGDLPGHAFLER